MRFTRRQLVEGGLAAGFMGLAAKPVLAGALQQEPGSLNVRRRPDGAFATASQPTVRTANPFRQPHPGQPLPQGAVRPVQVAAPRPTVPAQPRVLVDRTVNPRLVAAARSSFDRHRNQISNRDFVGIVDFSKRSNEPRFFILNTGSGRVSEHHVAHGRGSDPSHSGFLQRFSNTPGSEATSEGAYLTTLYYQGRYGRSMRVRGLDYTNNNAESRAIVVHSAWYAEPTMLATHGMLGRSEGCFAMSYNSLQQTMAQLSPGHMIYAARVA